MIDFLTVRWTRMDFNICCLMYISSEIRNIVPWVHRGLRFALCCGFESHPWQLFVKKRVVVGVCGLFCLLFALLCFALTLLFAYTCELVTNRCQQRSIKAKARKQVKYTLDSFQEQCFEVLRSLVWRRLRNDWVYVVYWHIYTADYNPVLQIPARLHVQH